MAALGFMVEAEVEIIQNLSHEAIIVAVRGTQVALGRDEVAAQDGGGSALLLAFALSILALVPCFRFAFVFGLPDFVVYNDESVFPTSHCDDRFRIHPIVLGHKPEVHEIDDFPIS